MMKKLLKNKKYLIILAVLVVGIVALIAPEYAENVARAFMLIIAGV